MSESKHSHYEMLKTFSLMVAMGLFGVRSQMIRKFEYFDDFYLGVSGRVLNKSFFNWKLRMSLCVSNQLQ